MYVYKREWFLLAFLYRQKVVSIGDLSDDFINSFYRRCLQIFHHRPQLAMSAKISSSSSICINLRHFYNSKTNTNICVQHILHTLKQTQNFVFIHILQYVYFRGMLQDYLSVTWIVFWNSMFVAFFLLRHHPKWIGLRHLQYAIHSQRVCSLYDSLSFFLLGNKIMYHLSMWINNLNKVWLQFFSFINWTCFGMLITRGFFH